MFWWECQLLYTSCLCDPPTNQRRGAPEFSGEMINWVLMGFLGGSQWVLMGTHENSWVLMGSHGFSVGSQWVLSGFSVGSQTVHFWVLRWFSGRHPSSEDIGFSELIERMLERWGPVHFLERQAYETRCTARKRPSRLGYFLGFGMVNCSRSAPKGNERQFCPILPSVCPELMGRFPRKEFLTPLGRNS